jgi:uncharacterized protein YndB with AHSA1/START domain
MSQSPVQFDTFVIERKFAAPLARVFAAFSDPAVKRRWFAAGHTHDIEHYSLQFEVGGREHARYRLRPDTPLPGAVLEADGVVIDIVPQQRIVIAQTMAIQGHRMSAALLTFEFSGGAGEATRMLFTHQAAFFEHADGPAMRRAGWEQLTAQLQRELDAGTEAR